MFMGEQGWKRQKASQYYENGFDLADPLKGPLGTLKIDLPLYSALLFCPPLTQPTDISFIFSFQPSILK